MVSVVVAALVAVKITAPEELVPDSQLADIALE